jgi:ribosome biogenesis GTPase
MAKGFITKVNSGIYTVYSDGKAYTCRARGKFRIGKYIPLVGDNVEFDDENLYLLKIYDRKNVLVRPPLANVDNIAIIASATNPKIPVSLINRFIVIAEVIGVKPIIIFTKIDIVEDEDYLDKINLYERLGYTCYSYSSKTHEGLEEIEEVMADKRVVFTGQSGVGKSTLINFLIPGTRQKTGEISKALGRGRHVTRVVEYLPYKQGFIADSPGFSSIEFDLEPVDLASFYPGFEKYYQNCKYRNCVHDKENGCAVKQAVENKEINQEYYEEYLALLNEIRLGKEKI